MSNANPWEARKVLAERHWSTPEDRAAYFKRLSAAGNKKQADTKAGQITPKPVPFTAEEMALLRQLLTDARAVGEGS